MKNSHMSKVDCGCYIDTTGMDDETRAKVEKVFVDKFGVDYGMKELNRGDEESPLLPAGS